MSITKLAPRTIHLGGPAVLINDASVGVATTPGMLVERYNNSGALQFRPNTQSTNVPQTPAVALNASMLNHTTDDVYAVGDLAEVAILSPGASAWMLIPSGQNITQGAFLESNGDGTLKVRSSGNGLFQALESVNNSAGPANARIRVEAV
jgi:hypothetical protein